MFSRPDVNDKWVTLSKEEVETLPSHAKALVENYCLYDTDSYFVPDYGFKKIDMALFLNHSSTPNLISINDGEYFKSIRDIKAGEALVLHYGEIVVTE